MRRPGATAVLVVAFGGGFLIIAAVALRSLVGIWEQETLDAAAAAGQTQ